MKPLLQLHSQLWTSCIVLVHLFFSPWPDIATIDSNSTRDLLPPSSFPALESVVSPASPYTDSSRRQPPLSSSIPTIRSRSELEEGTTDSPSHSHTGALHLNSLFLMQLIPFHSSLMLTPDSEPSRARKRQRIHSPTSPTIDQSLRETSHIMRFPESDHDSNLSISPDLASHAGPSSVSLDAAGPSNGYTNGNGFSTSGASGMGNGVTQKHGKSIAKVSLPGTTLYDDSSVDREEFVRLVIQSLRDVGYV